MRVRKKYIWFWIVLATVFVAAGIRIGVAMFDSFASSPPAGASEYAAVYMSTGDVYYGKISWFPRAILKDVWYLQQGTGASGTQVSVTPLTAVFWAPVSDITLNTSQIIFWTYLRSDSPVVAAIKAK